MNILILTSCCYPNTSLSVSDLTPNQRFSDLCANIVYLSKKAIFDFVVIVDPSLDMSRSKLTSLEVLVGEKFSTKYHILVPRLDKHEKQGVELRGKGYSELLLLGKAIEYITSRGWFDSHIFKLSARYRLFNIRELVLMYLNANSPTDCKIGLTFSLHHASVSTIFFSFPIHCSRHILNCIDLIDDRLSDTIESVFFDQFVLKSSADYTRLPDPIFCPGMRSGSQNKVYGIFSIILQFIKVWLFRAAYK
jgi:hypothetical protein